MDLGRVPRSPGGIHQFVPMLHVGDAVGGHTAAVQELLVAQGIDSQIYVELIDPETADRTRLASSYPGEAQLGDVLLYQFATASDLAQQLASRAETLIVNYHNVTPPSLFAAWDNSLAVHQVRALADLSQLAARAVVGVAVSEVNRQDLVAAGFPATAVIPPIVTLPSAAPGGHRSPRRRGARWLMVGRLAPNKAVEDAIAALLAYRIRHDPDAELLVVGRSALAAYSDALRRYAADLGLAEAVRFSGMVSDEALAAAYASADVLVVTSEHEGFCLPVVEALASALPVVAYREGALPEVLGDAGVLLDAKDPITMADAVRRLLTDAAFRDRLTSAGEARLSTLDMASSGARLVEVLVAAKEGLPWPAGVNGTPAASR